MSEDEQLDPNEPEIKAITSKVGDEVVSITGACVNINEGILELVF